MCYSRVSGGERLLADCDVVMLVVDVPGDAQDLNMHIAQMDESHTNHHLIQYSVALESAKAGENLH